MDTQNIIKGIKKAHLFRWALWEQQYFSFCISLLPITPKMLTTKAFQQSIFAS